MQDAGYHLAEVVVDHICQSWRSIAIDTSDVSNDPDEHIEQIRPYLELGFTHLVFHHPGDDQSRFIKLYADQILPRLRNWSK